jgi:SAM-dependent methyltransferase
MISNKICLENFKTSLTDLVNTHKKSNFQKIIKYIKNPLNILPRILYVFKKYKSEIDWNERSEKMGNSSVYGNLIDEEEQKKITDIHRKILLKCLDGKISKESKVLDFGCGYGRFSDFFVYDLDCNYFGVENTEFFLKNINNEKKKTYLNFNQLTSKKFDDFFDVIFVFAVFGGFKKKKLLDIFNMLKTKIKSKSKIVVVEAISEKNVEGVWSFRTEQYYKKLLSNFDISTKFYFLEDNKFKQIFFGKNFKKKELSS